METIVPEFTKPSLRLRRRLQTREEEVEEVKVEEVKEEEVQ